MVERKRKFAIIGVGGYIAHRHLDAIQQLGHEVVAAYDISDSVGILDRYFPAIQFFTSEYDFYDFLKNRAFDLDFVSICSPNDMHARHIEMALRLGANVICEKPVVLTVLEVDRLAAIEKETGCRVFTILQLRSHQAILALKARVDSESASLSNQRHRIHLDYVTSRGPWYQKSWKGQIERSGGLSANIGIHFFDMLLWMFGEPTECKVTSRTAQMESGSLQLKSASVEWRLSIDRNDLPEAARRAGKTTYRCLTIDGQEFEFSEGFTELHNQVYSSIMENHGYGLADARGAIELVEQLRGM